jgi:uncharacterized protein (UPF0261 family)
LRSIWLAGTADTKSEELAFLHAILAQGGLPVVRVDLSTAAPAPEFEISAAEVAAHHPQGAAAVLGLADRGRAVTAMGEAFAALVRDRADGIAGILAIGGGGGTSIATAGMRELPHGIPKFMVSTLAGGDVAPYVGLSDIVMLPSVTDMAGLNRLSRRILSNAAHALLGAAEAPPPETDNTRPAIGLSMFGVTTQAVTDIAGRLRGRYDCHVFHATGTGGRAMEKLLRDGGLTGLLDITTTEIADHLCGGVLSAGPERLAAVAETGAPWLGAPGALDMVNFWAPETVSERYEGRLFHHHNPNVTLMRTTAGEMARIGAWIGARLNACDGPVRFLFPRGGVSTLDIPGGAFHDPEADAALLEALSATLKQTDRRRLIELPCHINDAEFAARAVAEFLDMQEE